MRIILRITLLLFVVVGMVFYFFYLRTGGDLPPIRNLLSTPEPEKARPDLRQLSTMPGLNSVEISEKDLRQIVRWQDENGMWHFSNEKQATPGVDGEKPEEALEN